MKKRKRRFKEGLGHTLYRLCINLVTTFIGIYSFKIAALLEVLNRGFVKGVGVCVCVF